MLQPNGFSAAMNKHWFANARLVNYNSNVIRDLMFPLQEEHIGNAALARDWRMSKRLRLFSGYFIYEKVRWQSPAEEV